MADQIIHNYLENMHVQNPTLRESYLLAEEKSKTTRPIIGQNGNSRYIDLPKEDYFIHIADRQTDENETITVGQHADQVFKSGKGLYIPCVSYNDISGIATSLFIWIGKDQSIVQFSVEHQIHDPRIEDFEKIGSLEA